MGPYYRHKNTGLLFVSERRTAQGKIILRPTELLTVSSQQELDRDYEYLPVLGQPQIMTILDDAAAFQRERQEPPTVQPGQVWSRHATSEYVKISATSDIDVCLQELQPTASSLPTWLSTSRLLQDFSYVGPLPKPGQVWEATVPYEMDGYTFESRYCCKAVLDPDLHLIPVGHLRSEDPTPPIISPADLYRNFCLVTDTVQLNQVWESVSPKHPQALWVVSRLESDAIFLTSYKGTLTISFTGTRTEFATEFWFLASSPEALTSYSEANSTSVKRAQAIESIDEDTWQKALDQVYGKSVPCTPEIQAEEDATFNEVLAKMDVAVAPFQIYEEEDARLFTILGNLAADEIDIYPNQVWIPVRSGMNFVREVLGTSPDTVTWRNLFSSKLGQSSTWTKECFRDGYRYCGEIAWVRPAPGQTWAVFPEHPQTNVKIHSLSSENPHRLTVQRLDNGTLADMALVDLLTSYKRVV